MRKNRSDVRGRALWNCAGHDRVTNVSERVCRLAQLRAALTLWIPRIWAASAAPTAAIHGVRGRVEALKMIRQPEFLAHAIRLGDIMREVMEGWKARWPIVGDVRGLGPMMLVELVTDRETGSAAPADALGIIKRAVANGVLLIRAGLFSNCIRFLPPLNMPEDMLQEALSAVGQAIEVAAVEKAEAVPTGAR